MDRRAFLRGATAAATAAITCRSPHLRGEVPTASAAAAGKLTLGVPLTHSDWALKPNIPWGEPGVRHMLVAC